jgi:2-polyprenyl-3-methyl-5-hydroxy-6-metoxy-1,4-benzoquinol methylase
MTLRSGACLNCGELGFKHKFEGRVIEQHVLRQCANCGMVQAFLADGHEAKQLDYSGWGAAVGYLIVLDQAEIRVRVNAVARQYRRHFRRLVRRFGSPTVLDFGSGGGYFGKAAQEFGFETYGVDASSVLREFSKDRVGFRDVYPSLEILALDLADRWGDDRAREFDVIFLSDVIEHFHPSWSRHLMARLLDHLKPGGLLIGNTPNVRSLNILLFQERDPVVAPPSHLCYFSLKTLDQYLRNLGLLRQQLYSLGLSSDSFFRPSKFAPSFLEKPPKGSRLLAGAVQKAFGCAGHVMRLWGLGYQIYFTYEKPR